MKTIIIYASVHHGNTKKLAETMAECISADIADITENPDISGYDMVGFASGIYFHSFHEKIKKYISNAYFKTGQKVFLADTCGIGYRDYSKDVKKVLAAKGVECVGSFQCRGYDTFGIFGKIGGIAKKHPNDNDLKNACEFVKNAVR